MKSLLSYLLVAFVAGSLLFGWGYYQGKLSVKAQTEIRIDTVFYKKPQPYEFSVQLIRVNVPKLLFAQKDTIIVTSSVDSSGDSSGDSSDSVQMDVPVQRLEYRDSNYYACVSGPVVGSLTPRLDWIETYNRTVTQTATKHTRFAITAGVGVGYTSQGIQPYVGVSAGIILWKF